MNVIFITFMCTCHFFGLVSIGITIPCLCENGRNGLVFTASFFLIFAALCFGCWWAVIEHGKYDYVGTTKEFTSLEAGGVDIIVEDGNVINLNEKFSRDVEVGTVVVKTCYDKDYGWFYSDSFPEYSIKETE